MVDTCYVLHFLSQRCYTFPHGRLDFRHKYHIYSNKSSFFRPNRQALDSMIGPLLFLYYVFDFYSQIKVVCIWRRCCNGFENFYFLMSFWHHKVGIPKDGPGKIRNVNEPQNSTQVGVPLPATSFLQHIFTFWIFFMLPTYSELT